MNFLVDEGVDVQIVQRLRRDGHTVEYVAEMGPGLSDAAILELAIRSSALLITADKDFGDLVFRQRRVMTGIMLIRLAGLAPSDKADTVADAIREHSAHLSGAFTVITPRSVRIRRPRL